MEGPAEVKPKLRIFESGAAASHQIRGLKDTRESTRILKDRTRLGIQLWESPVILSWVRLGGRVPSH